MVKLPAPYLEIPVTMLEKELLSVLKELLEASHTMTCGALPSADDMERFQRAKAWSCSVLEHLEKSS